MCGQSQFTHDDIMTLLEILLGTGLIVGVGVASLVYLDCLRRGMHLSSRLVRALACGGGAFSSFLIPHIFSEEIRHLYFQVLKPRPIVIHPREWLLVNLTAGFVIGVVLVGLYLTESRFRSRKQADTL